jgi:hypothetical protein
MKASNSRKEERDQQLKEFQDRLMAYVSAHNERTQARLAAIAYGTGGSGTGYDDAMSKLMQERRK